MTDLHQPQPQVTLNHSAGIVGEDESSENGAPRTAQVPAVEGAAVVPTLIGGPPPGAAALEARTPVRGSATTWPWRASS